MSFNILIVDDNQSQLLSLKRRLERNFNVFTAEDSEQTLSILRKEDVNIVLLDIHLGAIDGLSLLPEVREIDDDIVVLMLTVEKDQRKIIEAFKKGAFDYVLKEWEDEEILIRVDKAVTEHQARIKRQLTRRRSAEITALEKLIKTSKSQVMQAILNHIEKLARGEMPILITGETGTGKEIVARAIHERQVRENPDMIDEFVAVNCSAIPSTLIESELFGHEKGAYTGANKRRRGFFELANKGTIFLDEIADMSPGMQAKILRTIQYKRFRRLGGEAEIEVNFRIIAATKNNIEEKVLKKEFREDLYYRLAAVRIDVPPLRSRAADFPPLADLFIDRYGRRMKKNIRGINQQALSYYQKYAWPGNIRQLEAEIERSILFADEDATEITCELLDTKILGFDPLAGEMQAPENPGKLSLKDLSDLSERSLIISALKECKGNKTQAAEKLQLSRKGLNDKIKRLNIKWG